MGFRFSMRRKVEAAGGGTLDPPLLPRPRSPSSGKAACRIADDEGRWGGKPDPGGTTPTAVA
jgi:hypothetical protein